VDRALWKRVIRFGIDQNFSRSDRMITVGVMAWGMFWFLVFAVGS
jgi:hypothetical protein